MMQEKAMVSDALNTLNSGLKTYTDMISQTENQELRSALQQMRNETENSQFELYKIAKNKNYYQPAGQASQSEINSLKSIFSGSTGWAGANNMSGSNSGMAGSAGMSGGNSDMAGGSGMSGSNSGMTGSAGMSGGNSMAGSSGNSGNSFNKTGLTGSQEGLGLTGSSGLTANSGVFGDKGMSDTANAFQNVGGMGNTGAGSSLGSSIPGGLGNSGK
jgi:hypothetical protein